MAENIQLNSSKIARSSSSPQSDGATSPLVFCDTGDDTGEVIKRMKLARTIENEIIPRLLLAHQVAQQASHFDNIDTVITSEEIADFARIILQHEVGVARSYVDAMQRSGVSRELLVLQLFAPTARYLGKLWDEDLCDFTQVTIGLSRLQTLLSAIAPLFVSSAKQRDSREVVLLTAMPGEQHTLGIFIVEEYFRSAGWDVKSGPFATCEELCARIQEAWVAVIGISVSGETMLQDVSTVIARLRRLSCNPQVNILVGGGIFAEHPEMAEQVGADATARDGREAVLRARELLL